MAKPGIFHRFWTTIQRIWCPIVDPPPDPLLVEIDSLYGLLHTAATDLRESSERLESVTKKLVGRVVVHWVRYADQPDIQFACDGTWSTPAWMSAKLPNGAVTDTPGVFLADNGRCYTLERKLATCPECLATKGT
jgi:hypothetical protein